jgi:hypothetical protein
MIVVENKEACFEKHVRYPVHRRSLGRLQHECIVLMPMIKGQGPSFFPTIAESVPVNQWLEVVDSFTHLLLSICLSCNCLSLVLARRIMHIAMGDTVAEYDICLLSESSILLDCAAKPKTLRLGLRPEKPAQISPPFQKIHAFPTLECLASF